MISYPNINPIILNIYGPMRISWYSLSYLFGFLFIYKFIKKNIDKSDFQTEKQLDSFFNWSILSLILFARIFYIIFYDLSYYISNPSEIIATWHGGLSFHGGVFGILLCTFVFSKKYKIGFLRNLDLISINLPIGIFFGRIANFINSELYGRASNCHFCMIFPNDPLQIERHPSQLYEAFTEGLILFCIMRFVLYKFNKILTYRGLSTGLFGMLYSIFRFFIEFFRQPDSQIGFIFNTFTMGQILCFIMFVIAFFLTFYAVKKKTTKFH